MNAVTRFYRASLDTLASLYERWQDEKEHENIAGYQRPLDKIAAKEGVTIERMTKRPFGCVFTVRNRRVHIFVKKCGKNTIMIQCCNLKTHESERAFYFIKTKSLVNS